MIEKVRKNVARFYLNFFGKAYSLCDVHQHHEDPFNRANNTDSPGLYAIRINSFPLMEIADLKSKLGRYDTQIEPWCFESMLREDLSSSRTAYGY